MKSLARPLLPRAPSPISTQPAPIPASAFLGSGEDFVPWSTVGPGQPGPCGMHRPCWGHPGGSYVVRISQTTLGSWDPSDEEVTQPGMRASGLCEGALMEGKQSSALPGESEPWGPGPASQGAWQKPATFCWPLAEPALMCSWLSVGREEGKGRRTWRRGREGLSRNPGESQRKLGRQMKNIPTGQPGTQDSALWLAVDSVP